MPLKPRRLLSFLCLVPALAAAVPAGAQETPGPRTGPGSAPPPPPPYAAPAPQALPAPDAVPAEAAAATAAGAVREVRILAEQEGPDARPPSAWQPPADSLSGLRLDHQPGEPLGAAWVRRQFDAHAIAGGEAARAIALVQLVNRAFLTAGFINSGLLVAPPDAADPGLLILRLVHGRIVAPAGGEAVAVEWTGGRSAGLDDDYIRDRMPSARRQPVSAVAIERDFRLLAENDALRTINAQLRPGAVPGEASLSLVVLPRDRADFYLTAGNSRSPSVGGERAAIGGLVRNLVAGGDLLSGEAGLTEGVLDASLAYATPVLDPRTTLSVRGSLNRAAVVDRPLAPLDIRSREQSVEASISRRIVEEPLIPLDYGRWSPSRRLSLGLGLGWRRQRSFLLGQPFSFAPGSVDGRAEYVAARLLGDYVLRSVNSVFALSVTGTVGLDGTRSSQPGVLNPGRHFTALLVQLNHARRLSRRGLELRARLTGQMSDGVLYSGERLSFGGESSVRGYRESLLLGDRGVIGSLELAQPFSLSGAGGAGRGFNWGAFSIAAFADAGAAWNAEGPDPDPHWIASVGPALAWQPSDALTLSVAWGIALRDARITGSRDLQDDGLHVRLTFRPLRLLGRGD